ncbi:MAG: hypothetical protein MUD01_10795 [Chloroflexaceae bacterium]|jgi:glutathione synthase/RimK-type ligase-like ATP-grasp enzyme|nr:hypothetical protein [Chloroflexaceae bacterium]
MHIALATYSELPLLSSGDRLLQAALRQRGHRADAAIWDDQTITWQAYDAVVIRSCWDYHRRPEDFRTWIDRLENQGVALWNPPAMLRWNLDKRYLLDLAAGGVPVVPTLHLERGSNADLRALLLNQGWDEAVVKPTIAATSFHTWRTGGAIAERDQQRLTDMLAERSLLVQPLMPQIAEGEWSLLFFGGAWSHAVLKRPAPGDFRSQGDFGGTAERREPPSGLIEQAEAILNTLTSPWLYARVDGLLVNDIFTLMELELIEPSLFLTLAPGAAEQLALACERMAVR